MGLLQITRYERQARPIKHLLRFGPARLRDVETHHPPGLALQWSMGVRLHQVTLGETYTSLHSSFRRFKYASEGVFWLQEEPLRIDVYDDGDVRACWAAVLSTPFRWDEAVPIHLIAGTEDAPHLDRFECDNTDGGAEGCIAGSVAGCLVTDEPFAEPVTSISGGDCGCGYVRTVAEHAVECGTLEDFNAMIRRR